VKLFDEIRDYLELVSAGADPIEALHGHICGPDCWHWPFMSDVDRQRALPAWNLKQQKMRDSKMSEADRSRR
jgi:hypothetical protein